MGLLKVAIVDDEPLARRRLSTLLVKAGCEVLSEHGNAASLLSWLKTHPLPDALFLDVQLAGLSGFEILEELPHLPAIVFVTAHPDFAVRAFELAAVDYVLKPISLARLTRSVEKIHQHCLRTPPEAADEHAMLKNNGSRFVVKSDVGTLFLELKKVSHFELDKDAVWAWAEGSRHRCMWNSLSDVEDEFPQSHFVRIQRHILLRPESVMEFQGIQAGRIKVRVGTGIELEVSRTTTPTLKNLLGVR